MTSEQKEKLRKEYIHECYERDGFEFMYSKLSEKDHEIARLEGGQNAITPKTS